MNFLHEIAEIEIKAKRSKIVANQLYWHYKAYSYDWKDGRVVECGGLENR